MTTDKDERIKALELKIEGLEWSLQRAAFDMTVLVGERDKLRAEHFQLTVENRRLKEQPKP